MPARSPVQTALVLDFSKTLTRTGLLLAGVLYLVGIFGPLEPFSPSVSR